jgi:hypothetical protein
MSRIKWRRVEAAARRWKEEEQAAEEPHHEEEARGRTTRRWGGGTARWISSSMKKRTLLPVLLYWDHSLQPLLLNYDLSPLQLLQKCLYSCGTVLVPLLHCYNWSATASKPAVFNKSLLW